MAKYYEIRDETGRRYFAFRDRKAAVEAVERDNLTVDPIDGAPKYTLFETEGPELPSEDEDEGQPGG
jgi:hypothetical protein